MVLCFGRADAAGRRPERIVMTGGTGLRHQRVMASLTIVDRRSQNDIMVLTHCRITTGRSPEGRVVAELTAVHSRDIR